MGDHKFTGEIISGSALLYDVGALVVYAVVVVMFARGRLAYEPERAVPRTADAGSIGRKRPPQPRDGSWRLAAAHEGW